MFSEAKRAYLKRLGYSESRIRQLEREAKATKEKSNRICELVYKQLTSGKPAKLSANARRIVEGVTKQKEQSPASSMPNVWHLIARSQHN